MDGKDQKQTDSNQHSLKLFPVKETANNHTENIATVFPLRAVSALGIINVSNRW